MCLCFVPVRAVPVACDFHLQAVFGSVRDSYGHGRVYDFPVPYLGEHLDDYRTYARDGTSAPVPVVWRLFCVDLHGASRILAVPALPGAPSIIFVGKFSHFSRFVRV